MQFQPSYGDGCMKHIEPGSGDCYDQNTHEELPVSGPTARQPWCQEEWCYVDACNCNTDMGTTVRFTQPDNTSIDLVYSYQTCGGEDFFADSTEAAANNGIIRGECSAQDSSDSMLNTFSLLSAVIVVAITGRSMFRKV